MGNNSSFAATAMDRLKQARAWALDSPWLERIARFGYAAKGIVYLLVAALAVPAAFGAADDTLGMHGALYALVGGMFGTLLLGAIGIGLLSYVVWRFIQAIVDPEGKGAGVKGFVQRIAYAVSGAIFANLAFDAVELVIGWTNDPRITAEDWTRALLAIPVGRWLVGLVGAIVIAIALHQFYGAYSAKFRHKFKLTDMSKQQQRWVIRLGRIGYAARGVVFAIIGWLLIRAALESNARMAGGISDALLSLMAQPLGPWLLGSVACGLVAYGLYVVAEARYRRIIFS